MCSGKVFLSFLSVLSLVRWCRIQGIERDCGYEIWNMSVAIYEKVLTQNQSPGYIKNGEKCIKPNESTRLTSNDNN